MGLRSNDLDFSAFDDAMSSQEPKEKVYDLSVFDNAVKKKEPLEPLFSTSQDGGLVSTTSTATTPKKAQPEPQTDIDVILSIKE